MVQSFWSQIGCDQVLAHYQVEVLRPERHDQSLLVFERRRLEDASLCHLFNQLQLQPPALDEPCQLGVEGWAEDDGIWPVHARFDQRLSCVCYVS